MEWSKFTDVARGVPGNSPLAVRVCWENANGVNALAKRGIMNAVRQTWSKAANVDFVYWGQCGRNERGIILKDGTGRPLISGLGGRRPTTITLNTTFGRWMQRPCKGANKINCWVAQAITQFGHALGFVQDKTCTDHPRLVASGSGLGQMERSYCANDWNTKSRLTTREIELARFGYGVRAADRTTSGRTNGCSVSHVAGGVAYASCRTPDWFKATPERYRVMGRLSSACSRGMAFKYDKSKPRLGPAWRVVCVPTRPAPRLSGTFTRSCSNIQKTVLPDGTSKVTAKCKRKNGSTRTAELCRYEDCFDPMVSNQQGSVNNDDGFLKCNQIPKARQPTGSYTRSCDRIFYTCNTLVARCTKRGRTKVTAWLRDAHKCKPNSVANNGGKLTCRK